MKKEYFEILLENLNNKIDLIVEGHQNLDKKIDNRFNELNQKLNDNQRFMRVLNKDLTLQIDKTANDLNTKIDKTANDLNTKIDKTANDLNAKIDKTAEKLDKKIDHLNKNLKEDIKQVENKIDSIIKTDTDHKKRITRLERYIHN